MFLKNDADLAVIFSHNFSDKMRHSGKATIQLLADGSEPNQAAVRTSYMQQILAGYLQDYIQQERSHTQMAQAAVSSVFSVPNFQIIPITRMLYNPQSRSEYNFVPGVIGLILLLICAMMTSIAIVKKKEMGTMEILLASPTLPPIVIVVAKLVPYFVIFIILSGLITPVTSTPEWAKAFTHINPLHYFIETMRTLYLKGSNLYNLRYHFYALSGYAVVMWAWAIKSYQKNS